VSYTLDEIRSWPAAVSIERAAEAFGISRSHAYELARTGHFPARTLKVGSTVRVVTASIVEALSA
jgi:predicted DNA-binding transcriptional regulator AlpA